MQKHVNLVDLVKSFPTNIFLQNSASIQKRTSPIKFAHLAEKSENGSISNLSTKLHAAAELRIERQAGQQANKHDRDWLDRPRVCPLVFNQTHGATSSTYTDHALPLCGALDQFHWILEGLAGRAFTAAGDREEVVATLKEERTLRHVGALQGRFHGYTAIVAKARGADGGVINFRKRKHHGRTKRYWNL